jgi:hypothetical protein
MCARYRRRRRATARESRETSLEPGTTTCHADPHDIDTTRKEVHDMKINLIQHDEFAACTARFAGADVTGPTVPGAVLSSAGGLAAAMA